jgi:hypothetical protein
MVVVLIVLRQSLADFCDARSDYRIIAGVVVGMRWSR